MRALPHFSQKHESARKNQTPFSGPTLMLVRKKTGHSEGPGDSSWEYEISGEMPVVR